MTRMTALLLCLTLGMLSGCAGTPATSSIPPAPTTAASEPTAARPIAAPTSPSSTSAPQPTLPPAIAATSAAAEPTIVAAATPEQAVAPEQSPAGDIPDTQAFVAYTASPGGYALDVPEGWARSTDGANVRFVDKLNGVSLTVAAAQAAPTVQSARDNEVAALVAVGRAMTVTSIEAITLPGGPALLVKSTANSDPDLVTAKHVRLEQNIYLFYKAGSLATLTLWAPLGADNVDQWQRIAQSFRWS